MTGAHVMTGGRKPTRHHHLLRLFVATALAGLAFGLVFTSGYLIGSSGPDRQSATAVKSRQAVLQGLPGPVPSATTDSAPKNSHPGRQHKRTRPRFVRVKQGDSLWGIATAIAPNDDPQVVIRRILRLNSLRSSAGLEIGQRLAVPGRSHGNSREQHRQGAGSAPAHGLAAPVSVSIPRLQLHQDLIELNVTGGTLEVPTNYSDVGWWRDGPSPGEHGSAVLVGHVDSKTGPAVFYELSAIHIGDPIVVRHADGTKSKFRVSNATLYPRESFPSSTVYREHGRPTLTLLTCGGIYDRTAGHYDGNLVVTAHLDSHRSR